MMTASLPYSTAPYYHESGEFSAARLPIALVGGVIVAIVCACIYAFSDIYVPWMIFRVVLTIGFGTGAGALIGRLLRWGEVRNRRLRIAAAALLAVVAYYATWVFWLSGLLGKARGIPGAFALLRVGWHPQVLWQLICIVNRAGAWSIGSHSAGERRETVNGLPLWFVWGVEALIIVIGIIVTAEKAGAAFPYCEACKRWARTRKQLFTVRLLNLTTLRQQLENRDFAPMLAQSPAPPADRDWLEIWVHSCDQCQDFSTLSVKQIDHTVDRKGKVQRRTRTKISHLLLNTVDLRALQSIRAQQLAARDKPIPAETSTATEDVEEDAEDDESGSDSA